MPNLTLTVFSTVFTLFLTLTTFASSIDDYYLAPIESAQQVRPPKLVKIAQSPNYSLDIQQRGCGLHDVAFIVLPQTQDKTLSIEILNKVLVYPSGFDGPQVCGSRVSRLTLPYQLVEQYQAQFLEVKIGAEFYILLFE